MYEDTVVATPGEAPTTSRQGLPIEPRRLLAAVRRGKFAIAIAGVIGLAGGVGVALKMPRTYEASGVLAIDTAADGDEARRLKTLSESVKLPTVIEETKARLHLDVDDEALARSITVEPGENANLFTVTTTATRAEAADALAQTVIDVFLEEQLALEKKKLDETVDATKLETAAARDAFDAIGKTWDDFRATNGVVDPTAELSAALERLGKLETEAQLAAVTSQAEEAREEALKKALAIAPSNVVLSSKEARPVEEKLGALRAERHALEGRLSAEHPRMQALDAQIAALEGANKGSDATVTVEQSVGINPGVPALQHAVTGAAADHAAATKRKLALDATIASATEETRRLALAGGKGAELLVELQLARTRLDAALTAEATALDRARHPSSGLRVIAPPSVPDRPLKSLRKLVAAGAPIVAMFLFVIALLLREIARLKLVAPSELAFWSRLSVLGATTWNAKNGDEAGADELRISLREDLAGKDVLLVPFGDAARDAVRALAGDRLRAWEGPLEGPGLRRTSRAAEAVVIVVPSRGIDLFQALDLKNRVGRDDASIVVIGLGASLANVADRFVPRRST